MFTDHIYDFEWIDDFSAARNYAQQFVSLSHTFCWDADFFLDQDNYQKLLQAKQILFDYDLSYFTWNAEYINGVAKKQELRSFVYTSDDFYWVYPIHNQLRRRISDFTPQVYQRFDIEIHHRKDPQEKAHRYTQTHRILQKHIRDNPTDIRLLTFYASSCRHFKQYSEAINIYEGILRAVHTQHEYVICSLIEQYMLCLILNNEYHKAWSVLEYYLTLYPQNKILQLWHADKLYQKQEYHNSFILYSRSYRDPLRLQDFQEYAMKHQLIPMIDKERYQVHPAYMIALLLTREQKYRQAFDILHSVISLSTKPHVRNLYVWLQNDMNNNLNGWAISSELYDWIRNNIKNDSTILELGSGTGTEELCKFYNVYSVEHDKKWLNSTSSNYIYAPIKYQKGYNWYNIDILKESLPSNYDLLLIDGLPGFIGRKPFLDNLHLFNLDVPIIIDDTNHKDEQDLFLELNNKLNRKFEVISNGKKECKVIL